MTYSRADTDRREGGDRDRKKIYKKEKNRENIW